MLGEKSGPTIRNKSSVLQEVDRMIGIDGSPPSLEYFFCENAMTDRMSDVNFTRFGYDSVVYASTQMTDMLWLDTRFPLEIRL
jgi:hypothetical protein